MGDYEKLIVNAEVRVNEKELKAKIEELGLLDSAYHCSGVAKYINRAYPEDPVQLILVGQTKYGRGQDEFLDWLTPHVVQGSGADEVWSIQFSEYTGNPTLRRMRESKDDERI
jgi:hypothetical protein